MKKTRFISLLLCVCMVMSLFVGLTVTASAEDGVTTYTVVKGDYLLKICMRHGLNYYQCKGIIMVLNGFTSEQQLNRISPGQVIKLPTSNNYSGTTSTVTVVNSSSSAAKSTASVAGSNLADYTVGYFLVPVEVKKNDTLNGMCSKLGTDYNTYAGQILAINGLKNANSIQVGQLLWLPSLTAPSSGECYGVVAHKVASGENVTDICATYGINYLDNKKMVDGMNPSLNLNKIYANQVINIPVKTTGGTTSTIGTKINSDETSADAQISGYQITFSATPDGSPYAVVGGKNFATRAKAGTSVMIVPNPKSGFTVESIKVQRTDGQPALQVTGTSFTMPESNVIITLTYKQGLKIVKEASKNGSFDTLVYGAAATTAGFGDEIVISAYPDAGYSVGTVEYKRADAPASTPYTAVQANTDGVFRFLMPNYTNGTKVKVTFVKTQLCTLTYMSMTNGGKAQFLVNGEAVTSVKRNTNVTLKFIPDPGWAFDNNTFETAASITYNGTITPVATLVNNGLLKKIDDTTYSLFINSTCTSVTVPSAATTLFNNYNEYELVAEGDVYDRGHIRFNVTDSRTGVVRKNVYTAKPGDTVEIVPYPHNTNDTTPGRPYYEENVYVPDDATLARYDESKTVAPFSTNVPVQGTWHFVTDATTGVMMPLGQWTTLGYTFVMPANNIRVKPQFFKQYRATVTPLYYEISTQYSDFGTVTVTDTATGNPVGSQTPWVAGVDNVTVTVKCAQNWTVERIYYYNNTGRHEVNGFTVTATGATGTFQMPNQDTYVEVDYKQQYTMITINGVNKDALMAGWGTGNTVLNNFGEPVTLKVDGLRVPIGNQVPVNSVVSLEFTVGEGFELDRVERTGGSLVGAIEKMNPEGDGVYRYQLKYADAIDPITFAGQPPVTFIITTRQIEKPQYTVAHNLLNLAPATDGSYELYNVTAAAEGRPAGPVTNANLGNVQEGDEIVVRNITAPTGMVFKDIVISGVDYWVDGGNYRFIMPDHDVGTMVTFATVAKPYAIAYPGAPAATVAPYSAVEGDGVVFEIIPDSTAITTVALAISGATYGPENATIAAPDADGVFRYTLANPMPAEDLTVTVTLS